jgi:outer membrane receptor protein involved in Fe transport
MRENVGEFLTQGVELELKGSYKGHYGWINYTYNNAEDVQSGLSIYGMSPHAASTGLSLSAFERVNLSVWGYLRGERKMERADGKDTLGGYTQLNTTLRVNDLFTEGLEGYVSVYNLFDTDYEYPIKEFTTIPARGREGLLGIRYTL